MNKRALTLIELVLATVLGVLIMLGSVGVLENMQGESSKIQSRINDDMNWVEANHHLAQMVRSSSYLDIPQAAGTPDPNILILYNYNGAETGRYINYPANHRIEYRVDSGNTLQRAFNNVNAVFSAPPPTPPGKGWKYGRLIETNINFEVHYTAPSTPSFVSAISLSCRTAVAATSWAITIGSGTSDYSFAQGTFSFSDLKQTSDGGYIIMGSSDSVNWGGMEWPRKTCLIKLDNLGNVQWSIKFGGTNTGLTDTFTGRSVCEVLNENGGCDGYILTCNNNVFTGDSENKYNVLIRVTGLGGLSWVRCTDERRDGPTQNPPDFHLVHSVMQSFTSRTGCISDGFVFTGYEVWESSIPLVKIDSSGGLIWAKGIKNETTPSPFTFPHWGFNSVGQVFNASGDPNGYIAAGYDGRVTVEYSTRWENYVCVVKTTNTGIPEWSTKIISSTGGTDYAFNYADYIRQMFNSAGEPDGYIIGGYTGICNGTWRNAPLNGYALRLGDSGEYRWSRGFANGSALASFRISPTTDGGFIVGNGPSVNPSITKLNDDGGVIGQATLALRETESAVCWQEALNTSGRADGYIIVGTSTTGGASSYPGSIFIAKTDVEGNCPQILNPDPRPVSPTSYTIGVPKYSSISYIIKGDIPPDVTGGSITSDGTYKPVPINKNPGDP